MPTNADVNIIPEKMTATGDSNGYVKINENNNYEIVNLIPSTDVKGLSGTIITETFETPSSISEGRYPLAHGSTPATDTPFPQLAAYVASCFVHKDTSPTTKETGVYANLPYVWIGGAETNYIPEPAASSARIFCGTVTYFFYANGTTENGVYLVISTPSGYALQSSISASINWIKP